MTRTLVTAIVSTAAPGAERGALDAAIELGIGWGGWIPEGADHVDEVYRAHARWTTGDRGMAVRLNTRDGDGTLIVSFADDPDEGRAKFAANQCKQQRRPARQLVLPARGRTRIPDEVRTALLAWIDHCHISVLHVVGPSEDQEPGIQQATHDALVWVLEDQADGVPAIADTIARIAAELPNQPERPPLTTEDALRQIAHTGSDDVRPIALAELARRMAEVSGRPTHVAINPANVDAARAAGLDVQYLPADHPGVLRPLGRVSIGMSEADARELERVHAAWRGDLPEPDAVPEPTDSDAPTGLYIAGPEEAAFFDEIGRDPEVHQTVGPSAETRPNRSQAIPGYNAPAIRFAPCPCGGGEPGRPRHLPACKYFGGNA